MVKTVRAVLALADTGDLFRPAFPTRGLRTDFYRRDGSPVNADLVWEGMRSGLLERSNDITYLPHRRYMESVVLTDAGRQVIADEAGGCPMTATVSTEQRVSFIQSVAEHAACLIDQLIPNGEGACLGASAAVARVLDDHGIETVAVRGTYEGHDHWWLAAAGHLRIDVTRAQFDQRPIVESIEGATANESPYSVVRFFLARWTHGQAIAEFGRMFECVDVGEAWGRSFLMELSQYARQEAEQ